MDSGSHDMTWHLAKDEKALKLVDFEFLWWRAYYSWIRWQEDCQRAIANDDLAVDEIAILHIIRMNDRAKTAYELARLLNREDIANVLYSTKKLAKLDYIEKVDVKSGTQKAIAYKITDKGIENVEAYAKLRENTLLKLVDAYSDDQLKLKDATKTFSIMKSLYEESSRLAASYKQTDKK